MLSHKELRQAVMRIVTNATTEFEILEARKESGNSLDEFKTEFKLVEPMLEDLKTTIPPFEIIGISIQSEGDTYILNKEDSKDTLYITANGMGSFDINDDGYEEDDE